MEHNHIEDSIDDLIFLLNSQKETVNPSNNKKEPQNVKIESDVTELGSLLNSSYARGFNKPSSASRQTSSQPQSLANRILNATTKPPERSQLKGDLIARNFLNKTVNYSVEKGVTKQPIENKTEQEETNITYHPKVSSSNTRYLVFQPLLKDIKNRPKTPPDYGYYFKFANSEVKLIKYLLEENGFRETNNLYHFSIFWSSSAIKNEIYQCLGYYQKVNHFPKSHEITRKDSMHRNISRMQTTYGLKNFNFIPRSFILPTEASLLESDFEKHKGTMWYIVKPQASSQGRGIYVTDKLDEILPKQNNQIIVSHYINDPYLINGLKFDLRVYVAITSIHPLRIYMYQEGLVRFATVPYVKEAHSYANRFIHLTNYSINKRSENYVQNDDNAEDEENCSKWSFATFRTFLESQGIDYNGIFSRIEDVIIKTVLSIESVLFSTNVIQVPQRHNCFELLGFDVLLDSKLKPWLLEVNLSPSLACDSTLDMKIKGDMLSDLFNMVGIVPLDQRTFNEPSQFGKNQNLFSYGVTVPNFDKKTMNTGYSEAKPIETLTKDEKAVIRETNDEWERRGKFKRIYPCPNVNDYKNYFENERPYNLLLRNLINNNLKRDGKKVDSSTKSFQNPKRLG